MTAAGTAPAPPASCLARLYAESGLTRHVDPEIRFPRAGGLLASRLRAADQPAESQPCATCEGACSMRRYLHPTR